MHLATKASSRYCLRFYRWVRPSLPAGASCWGAMGELDLAKVRTAAGRAAPGRGGRFLRVVVM
jgi:hypothetical protein